MTVTGTGTAAASLTWLPVPESQSDSDSEVWGGCFKLKLTEADSSASSAQYPGTSNADATEP
eukprot:224970-Rhodomonas_salina.1